MNCRLARFALRAYPPAYRRERGAEILTTLDDLGAEGRSPCQLASLVAGGLRTRAGLRGSWNTSAVAADGLRTGAALVTGGYALMLLGDAWRLQAVNGMLAVAAAWALAAACVLIAPRIAGAAALAACGVSAGWWMVNDVHGVALEFAVLTLAAVAVPSLLALTASWRLQRSAVRISPAWLLAVLPQALLLSGAVRPPAGLFVSSSVAAVSAVLLLAALMLAPVDPRPAVASCVVMAAVIGYLAASSALGVWTWVAPLPATSLAGYTLVAAVLATAGGTGLRRITRPA